MTEPVVEAEADVAQSEVETDAQSEVEDDLVVEAALAESTDEADVVFGGIPSDELLDELIEEVVPEGDEFERGLQSLVDDELAPGPIEPVRSEPPADTDAVSGAFSGVAVEEPAAPEAEPIPEPATAGASATTVDAAAEAAAAAKAAAELTAAGLVKRTPKKRSAEAAGGGMPAVAASRTTSGQANRSPEEVRKMLSRYRSGLNKGRGDADSEDQ